MGKGRRGAHGLRILPGPPGEHIGRHLARSIAHAPKRLDGACKGRVVYLAPVSRLLRWLYTPVLNAALRFRCW